jgi:hypothetical protein
MDEVKFHADFFLHQLKQSPFYVQFSISQGKLLDLTGHNKQKNKAEKETKKDSKGRSRKNSSMSLVASGGDDVDSTEADLVAILANQVVKEEGKRLRAGLRAKKKGSKNAIVKKKISKFKEH